jgi:hypothetical protein
MARKTKTKTELMTTKAKTKLPAKTTAITPLEYGGLQQAYDHFNRELFGGKLPEVFFTMQRGRFRGYFSPDRFSGRLGKFKRHELALNPDQFSSRTDMEICSTLTHEQCHVWSDADTGKRTSYHDRKWGGKMKEVGLHPSSTGKPGGRETGYNVSHYIVPGGAFEQSFKRLQTAGWKLNLESLPNPRIDKSKTKFTCARCAKSARGKPSLRMLCEPCAREIVSCAGVPTRTMKLLDAAQMRSADSESETKKKAELAEAA